MGHVFEPAPSGRSKCRGCGGTIALDELRFGERLPSPYREGEMTLWFHPVCAAYKRPEPLLQALGETTASIADRDTLERAARSSLAHRRIPRIDGTERAPSGKARCRSCRQPIERGAWRIRLVFYEEGRFSPGGCVHLACRKAYFETDDLLDRLLWFSPTLSDGEREELRRACSTDQKSTSSTSNTRNEFGGMTPG
jgi:hypothetical protein